MSKIAKHKMNAKPESGVMTFLSFALLEAKLANVFTAKNSVNSQASK